MTGNVAVMILAVFVTVMATISALLIGPGHPVAVLVVLGTGLVSGLLGAEAAARHRKGRR